MNSGLNKTRLPLLPLLALQHLHQWEALPEQTSLHRGGALICCRVTRSDVTHVYFQHIHVNVITETPLSFSFTRTHTHCSLHTNICVCTLQSHWRIQNVLIDFLFDSGTCSMFLHTGCLSCLLPCLVTWWLKCIAMYVHTHCQWNIGWLNGERPCVSQGKSCERETQKARRGRNLVMAIDTTGGFSSLLSAAAVDHTCNTELSSIASLSFPMTPIPSCITQHVYWCSSPY